MGSEKSLYELMNEVSIVDFAAALLLISVIVVLIASQKDKLHEMFESWRKKTNFNENVMELINQLTEQNKQLAEQNNKFQADLRKFAENRSNDREVSKQIRDNLYGDINKLHNQIDELRESNKKSTRASIKDKIRVLYNHCHSIQKITDIEWDTLNDLIDDYESNDGTNSFIHSKVAIEMYKWERVSDDEYGINGDDK